MPAEFTGALSGTKVLEIAEGIAGPVCGMQLADLGAELIKVEPPGGDRARGWGPPFVGDQSAIFAHLNRGKRSVELDLATKSGRKALERLLERADVVVVHQDPRDQEALGWNWGAIAEARPDLVVCEITDLGTKGPLAGRAGSELVIQALSGFHRYIGRPEAPARVGYEIASVGAGMHAVQAVLAMLLRKARTGNGDHCEISLLGALMSLKQILLAAQSDPDVWEGFHLNGPHAPPDIGWETRDGQVTFDFRHGQRDQWVAFCRAVGLDRLLDDPEYEDWRSTIYNGDRVPTHGGVYRPVFERMTSAEASALINGIGGISVKFHDYAELLAHPQLEHLDPLVRVPGAPAGADVQIATPFRYGDGPAANEAPSPAPELGAANAGLGVERGRTR